jgi:hypothetical protein
LNIIKINQHIATRPRPDIMGLKREEEPAESEIINGRKGPDPEESEGSPGLEFESRVAEELTGREGCPAQLYRRDTTSPLPTKDTGSRAWRMGNYLNRQD